MNLDNHIHNNQLKIKVVPNSKKLQLIEENNQLKLYLRSVPEKGKANNELIKFFKKQFNLNVKIKSGLKSREKILRIE